LAERRARRYHESPDRIDDLYFFITLPAIRPTEVIPTDFVKDLVKALLKAILSTALSVLFGFFQIAVVFLLSELSDEKIFKLQDFYDTGFFLFFTVAIISNVLVEYYIDGKVQTNVYFNAFILIACFATSVVCMVAFSKIFLQIETTDKETSVLVQNVALAFSVAVSLLLKLILYFKRP
jgi:hypothetical protein